MAPKSLKQIFAKIDAQLAEQAARCQVRVEVRGHVRTHQFGTVAEAQSFWDRAARYGMQIDPRP